MPDDAPALQEREIQGLKYLDKLLPLLDRLHRVGCKRDKARNRKLHYDQYCLLVLLFLFNPTLRSLRALQQATLLELFTLALAASACGNTSHRPGRKSHWARPRRGRNNTCPCVGRWSPPAKCCRCRPR
jgi:hypothetical protein